MVTNYIHTSDSMSCIFESFTDQFANEKHKEWQTIVENISSGNVWRPLHDSQAIISLAPTFQDGWEGTNELYWKTVEEHNGICEMESVPLW